MIERSVSCLGATGFYKLAYYEWPGPANAPTLVCVHGLTRNGRDFFTIAQALSAHYRVICPDMPGRGRSDYLPNPADYAFPRYLADIATLLARLDVESVDWLGTSMGGLIGMFLAATPGNPIRRLALNDVGAFVSGEGLRNIAAVAGREDAYPSIDAMAAAFRPALASWGPLTDAQLRHLVENGARLTPEGAYRVNYDLHILDAMKAAPPQDVDLWRIWDVLKCPTLVLRGANSDILSSEVANAMTARGPGAKLIEFSGVGHAPALLTDDQIGAVRDFLLG